MVVGVSGHLGQTALTAAVKENKQEIAVVPILHLQMAEETAVEKRRVRGRVIRKNVSSTNGANGANVAKLVVVVKRKEQGHVKVIHPVREVLQRPRNARKSPANEAANRRDQETRRCKMF